MEFEVISWHLGFITFFFHVIFLSFSDPFKIPLIYPYFCRSPCLLYSSIPQKFKDNFFLISFLLKFVCLWVKKCFSAVAIMQTLLSTASYAILRFMIHPLLFSNYIRCRSYFLVFLLETKSLSLKIFLCATPYIKHFFSNY